VLALLHTYSTGGEYLVVARNEAGILCHDAEALMFRVDMYFVMRVLDKLFNVSANFNSGSPVAEYLRSLFLRPFVLVDSTYQPVMIVSVRKYFEDIVKKHGLHYAGDVFDCDNYAALASALAPVLANGNGVFEVWGELRIEKESGDVEIMGHAWTIVMRRWRCAVNIETNELIALLTVGMYEPQDGLLVPWDEKTGAGVVNVEGLGKLIYKPMVIIGR
jgi:hypothetical protein